MKIWGGYGRRNNLVARPATQEQRERLISLIREGRTVTPVDRNPEVEYGALSSKQLCRIAFHAHLLIYNMQESDDRRWWEEEFHGLKASLEAAGLNCTPQEGENE